MADSLFVIANLLVLPGWILLILAPRWRWSATLVAPVIVPSLLGITYVALLATNWPAAGGVSRLDEVMLLFGSKNLVLAGWLHYLAFDLFIGSWQVRDAARIGLNHLAVVPCLLLTLLLGPTGLICYFALRGLLTRRWKVES